MKKNELTSLQALRERKKQVAEQLAGRENDIKYDLYLYTHPMEWAVNSFAKRSGNNRLSAENIVKLVAYSNKFYRTGRLIFKIFKVIKKII